MMKKGFLQLLFLLMVIPSAAQVLPMDYSYCGYERSEQPIPDAAVKVYVQPTGGDDAPLIQQAIDMVSRQKPDARLGVRGAVLLGDGVFNLATPLRIRTSGVVLRGSGRDRTILRKTGYDRGALLYIEGQPQRIYGDTVDVENTPAGALSIGVKSLPKTWTTGTRLLVWRPSTAVGFAHSVANRLAEASGWGIGHGILGILICVGIAVSCRIRAIHWRSTLP